jgi:TolB-like protein/DNA-binding winged helix-turn-helix (wHTH) protein
MSSKTHNGRFLLGPWTIEPLSGSVIGPKGEIQHLEPKVMQVFACLAENPNDVVTRGQRLDVAWHGSSNADEQLTRAIGVLRRAFHDDPGNPKYIATVPKQGYRLNHEVRRLGRSSRVKSVAPFESIARFNGRNLGLFALALLVLALAYVAFNVDAVEPTLELAIADGPSIAVLPFVNMSEDPDNEYFSDGMTEDVIYLLSKIPDMKVIGRTSSFAFKGKNEDLRSIGQELGVNTLLEGSVRRSGDNVRIVAQLIDARDGTHIWSEAYERRLNDVFTVQHDIASAVIDAIEIHAGPVPQRHLPTVNWEAYRAFLQARAAGNRLEWRVAADLLDDALRIDPDFAEAYELLAFCYFHMTSSDLDSGLAQQRAHEAAEHAIALDAELVLAQAIYRTGDVGASSTVKFVEAMDWAYKAQPSNPFVLDSYYYILVYVGYFERALQVAEEYARIEPLSLDANLDLFSAYYIAGRTNEAMQTLDFIYEMGWEPNNWRWTIAGIRLFEGDDEGAVVDFEAPLIDFGHADTAWVSEILSTSDDPALSLATLDQRFPQIANSLGTEDPYNLSAALVMWYLYFGHLDRFYELILAENPQVGTWSDADEQIWHGHLLRRTGFTEHPDYLNFARSIGIVETWDNLGPPDYCTSIGGRWHCD